MAPLYTSAGFEIGNTLDPRTFPALRRSRPGPSPAGADPSQPPEAVRGSPIRARPFAFGVRSGGLRCLVAAGPFVGPGLVKRLDCTVFTSPNGNPQPFFNIFYDTSAYVTATNIPLADLPKGTAIWASAIADDQPATFVAEGGLTTSGAQGTLGGFMINQYVPDQNFFLGISVRNPIGAAFAVYGSLLVYEGILPSDYPAILA